MRDLIEEAKAARLRAHAPYSKFLVGAAMRGAAIEQAAPGLLLQRQQPGQQAGLEPLGDERLDGVRGDAAVADLRGLYRDSRAQMQDALQVRATS